MIQQLPPCHFSIWRKQSWYYHQLQHQLIAFLAFPFPLLLLSSMVRFLPYSIKLHLLQQSLSLSRNVVIEELWWIYQLWYNYLILHVLVNLWWSCQLWYDNLILYVLVNCLFNSSITDPASPKSGSKKSSLPM